MPINLFVRFVYVILPILLFGNNYLYAQCNQEIDFERISVEHGLSQGTVNCIIQDHKGFMWFGTSSGLNRFDGVTFKTYFSNSTDSCSISDNNITCLFEDSQKRLWIGTADGGLNLFNWKNESFTRFIHKPLNNKGLSSNIVTAVVEDGNGDIWIATADRGVNRFNPKTGLFIQYINNQISDNILPSNNVYDIISGFGGEIFIATQKGIGHFKPSLKKFTEIDIRLPNGQNIRDLLIRCIEIDTKGCMYIGTTNSGLVKFNIKNNQLVAYDVKFIGNEVNDIFQGKDASIWIATISGLIRYNIDTDSFESFSNNPKNPNSISSDFVRTVYEDNQNNIWVGTFGFGLNKYSRYQNEFRAEKNHFCSLSRFPSLTARSFLEENNFLWIGTYGDGVIRLNTKTSDIKQLVSVNGATNGLPDNYIYSISKAADGNFWFATFNGACEYNPMLDKYVTYNHSPKNSQSLPSDRIRQIFIDSKGTKWFAAFINNFSKLLPDGKSFKTYSIPLIDSVQSSSTTTISQIFEDSNGNFWIATINRGLFVFDRKNEAFVDQYSYSNSGSPSLSSNRVNCIFQDRKGRLWVGTENGLNLLNRDDKSFRLFNKASGLPNDAICGIIEDDYGIFWISTRNGLSRADFRNLETPKFRNFDKYDGLKNSEFLEGATYKMQNGILLLSGINNLNAFHPNNVVSRTSPPPVHIYRVEVNSTGSTYEEKQVKYFIGTDSVRLKHSQNTITFHFAALNYLHPLKNQYRYKLEGFDTQWMEPLTANQRFVQYNNLNPGKYTFRVIAAIPDGVWNEEGDTFHFTIRPPFIKTVWFYLLVSIFFTGVVFVIFKLRESGLIKSKKELERQVEERTRELVNQSEELLMQSEYLRQANEEIRATSEALTEQNHLLKTQNDEIIQKQNELEDQKNSLANLAWELQDKNEEITAQRNEIERQKKEITDSILYAQRIQAAVLPSFEQIKDLFPTFFIFNRPKSIVSGDFYWVLRIGKCRVIAVADCTGHGVPGGFMSMLGVLLLNEVISLNETIDPASALNKLRNSIISVLHQKGDFTDASDGMDISLCIIDDGNQTLTFSGANSSIIIFDPNSKNNNGITVLRSDRMPIAYHPLMQSFTNQTYKLSKDVVLYLYSDGLIDQFGGADGKKFQQNRLIDLIMEYKDKNLEEQGTDFEKAFDNWRGAMYQVDDVLLMGVKL